MCCFPFEPPIRCCADQGRFDRLKNANPVKQEQEQGRLKVENAEDDLVQKTEVAITLMMTVLENVCRFFLLHVLLLLILLC